MKQLIITIFLTVTFLFSTIEMTKTVGTDFDGNEKTSISQTIHVAKTKVKEVEQNLPKVKEDVHSWVDYIFNKITATISSIIAIITALIVLVNKIEKLGKAIPFLKFKKKKGGKK